MRVARRRAAGGDPAEHVAFNDRARRKVREILSTHYPSNISSDVDQAIRERFPVKLAREDMRPGGDRWKAA